MNSSVHASGTVIFYSLKPCLHEFLVAESEHFFDEDDFIDGLFTSRSELCPPPHTETDVYNTLYALSPIPLLLNL